MSEKKSFAWVRHLSDDRLKEETKMARKEYQSCNPLPLSTFEPIDASRALRAQKCLDALNDECKRRGIFVH